MFPHFFGFDFSAALPWTVGGFLLGVLLTALWRGLGIGRASSTQLQTALFDLNTLRAARDEREALTSKLQSDFGFLEIALADAERRASSVQSLTRANAELSKAEADSRAGWVAASTELSTVKTALQAQSTRTTTLEQRLQYITAESTAASAASETRLREIETLKANLAAAEARTRELEVLRSELAASQAASQARSGDIDKMRADLAAAASALQDVPKLKSEYTAAAAEIQTLRAELEKRGQVSAASMNEYKTAMQDLNATRNLSIKQADDIKALKAVCAKLEADLAAKASAPVRALGFAGRTQALKTRRRNAIGKTSGLGGTGKRAAVKIKAGANSAVSGRSVWPSATGTFFLNKASKWRGAPAQKGKGRVWAATGRGALVNGLSSAANGTSHSESGDVAALKARVASLSEELENFRRLRDAVVAANRIAAGES